MLQIIQEYNERLKAKLKLLHQTDQMVSKSITQRQIPTYDFIFVMLCLLLPSIGSANGASLDPSEVTALRQIAKELGKRDWKSSTSVDPCRSGSIWKPPINYVNQLNCTCSGELCHVSTIDIKGQSLPGVLPKSLVNLSRLTRIDLTRNYLSGSIPKEWGSMSLDYMSIIVNQLSGPIPKHIGNMATLTYLSIENNNFSGPVPAELGKLVNLLNLTLNANSLTGQLPRALTKLSKLQDFRISSNNFSGRFPDYFKSWPALKRLEVQGSGFKGPIPSSISSLINLTDLRISDLDGEGSNFPNLENMTKLKYLILRNCNISGSIPHSLASLQELKILDLSFNNLQGSIPLELQELTKLNYMYLTSNFLTGNIPDWIRTSTIGSSTYLDLSYNQFNKSSVPNSCNKDHLNFFRSSSRKLNSSLHVCLEETFSCPQNAPKYSLHINCGGKKITIGKTSFEADEEPADPAKFYTNKPEWGFSNTGHLLDVNGTYKGDYIQKNGSVAAVTDAKTAKLYTEARFSPISVTYYGRCLASGSYTVVLYFAEIDFKNNILFHRLGRRVFDIYIQEKLQIRDFDIVKAANGSEKGHIETFTKIPVDSGTIEIRLYYAGKGTTAVPARGFYGPLISAISVESDSGPPDSKKTIKIVIGSIASVIFLFIIAYGASIWCKRQINNPSREEVLKGIDLQTGYFTYQQIKAATDNFDPANKIGQGGFGSVYKGTLLDDSFIAVKQLSSKSSQGNREFVTEIGMISGLHHPNLVKLYGCCVEGSQLFLVYEYMVNNNLARALFDEDWPLKLDWPTRQKVCIEIARSLVFLHEESTIKIIHRDIKPTNVLLDENLNAKISDFGLARLHEEENTHISTRIAGTIGYMSPEYALWGYLTYKADVYSFGVVALEIVAGRSNMDFQPDDENFCLLDWAAVQESKGDVMGIIDPKLGSEYNKEEAVRMIKLALLCTNASPALRPNMSQVASMLQGSLNVQDSATNPNAYDWMVHTREQMEPADQSSIHSSDAPLKDSSS